MTQIDNYFRGAPRRIVSSSTRNFRLIRRAYRRFSRAGRNRHMRRGAVWGRFHRAQRRARFVRAANRHFRPAAMAVYEHQPLLDNIMSYVPN